MFYSFVVPISGIGDSVFLATLKEDIAIRWNEIIPWDKIDTDPGHNFNMNKHSYIVPLDGVYMFSVQKEGNQNFGRFFILVDRKAVSYIDGYTEGNSAPSGSSTVVLVLKSGQEVAVQNFGSTIVYGNRPYMRTFFAGHMITRLDL